MLGRGCRLEHVFLGGGSGGTTTSLALSHTYVMLRYRTLSWTSTHASCYATVHSLGLSSIRHATLLYVVLDLHTHTSSCATVRSLGLPRIHHATLLYVLLDFHVYVMLRYWTLSWTSMHTSCSLLYILLDFQAYVMLRYCTLSWTYTHTHVILRYCTFSWTRTHTSCYATVVLLDFHTYVMLRYCTFSWTSTHASGYATVRSLGLPCIRHVRYRTFSWTFMHTSCYAAVGSLRLPCICHATLLDVVLNFHTKVMLRYCTEYRKGSRKNLKRCCEEKMAEQLWKRISWGPWMKQVSCRRNDCFHFSCLELRRGLYTKITRIPIGTSTSNMINNIPWIHYFSKRVTAHNHGIWRQKHGETMLASN